MTNAAAAIALIETAIALGIHSRFCRAVDPQADQYDVAEACDVCRAEIEAAWAAEQDGERAAERAMWNHFETNDEHREEMEADDRRYGFVA